MTIVRRLTCQSRNLAIQGFDLTPAERGALRLGLRFSGTLCLALVIAALAARSPAALVAIAVVAVAAAALPRHPFDHLWNYGIRRFAGGPRLPATPVRKRISYAVPAAWLAGTAALLAAGHETAGLAAGAVMVALCTAMVSVHFCLPSTVMALWAARGRIGTRRTSDRPEG